MIYNLLRRNLVGHASSKYELIKHTGVERNDEIRLIYVNLQKFT
jgi:hypothetical protein